MNQSSKPQRAYHKPGSFKRLLSRVGPVFAVKVLAAGLAVALHILLARVSSPDVYGVYVFVQSLVGLAVIPGRLGMESASIRYVGVFLAEGDNAHLLGFVRASHAVTIGGCLLIGASLGFGAYLGLVEPRGVGAESYLPGTLLLPAFGLLAVLANLLTALRFPALSVCLNEALRPILTGIGAIAFLAWLGPPGAHHLLWINLAATLGCIGLLEWAIQTNLPRQPEITPSYRLREWATVGFSHSIISGAQFLLKQADILMLGMLMGPAEVALYSVATRLSDLSVFAQTSIDALIAPTISELHSLGEMDRLRRSLRQASILTSVFAAGILVFFYLLGRPLISLFGTHYLPGIPVLLWLSAGKLFGASLGPVGWIVSMTGHHKFAERAVTVSVLVNICLNLALIPTYGVLGAAAATVISNGLRNLVLWYFGRRYLELDSSWLTYWKTIFPSEANEFRAPEL